MAQRSGAVYIFFDAPLRIAVNAGEHPDDPLSKSLLTEQPMPLATGYVQDVSERILPH
jgi:hypothetical protein